MTRVNSEFITVIFVVLIVLILPLNWTILLLLVQYEMYLFTLCVCWPQFGSDVIVTNDIVITTYLDSFGQVHVTLKLIGIQRLIRYVDMPLLSPWYNFRGLVKIPLTSIGGNWFDISLLQIVPNAFHYALCYGGNPTAKYQLWNTILSNCLYILLLNVSLYISVCIIYTIICCIFLEYDWYILEKSLGLTWDIDACLSPLVHGPELNRTRFEEIVSTSLDPYFCATGCAQNTGEITLWLIGLHAQLLFAIILVSRSFNIHCTTSYFANAVSLALFVNTVPATSHRALMLSNHICRYNVLIIVLNKYNCLHCMLTASKFVTVKLTLGLSFSKI